MTLGERIRAAREAAGMTQKAVASAFGINRVSVTQWESDDTRPDQDRLPDLAKLLQVSLDWLVDEKGAGPLPKAEVASIRAAPDVPRLHPGELARDVPVMGTVEGGDDQHDFYLNGDVVDYVRRPPGLKNTTGLFALYVVGESMTPRYEDGELIYVSGHRRAMFGDYVVIEIHPAPDSHEVPGFLKRFIKKTATKLVCEQFNPPKQIEYDLETIRSLRRVYPTVELMGV